MLRRFMVETWRTHRWLAHLAVAMGYALAYWIVARTLGNAPWPFAAGLRIACLLWVPYRYWPALVAGEVGPLAYRNFEHADDFGVTWALLASVPPVLLGMPVVWWFRARAALFPSRDLVDVKKLLYCAFVLSGWWAAITLVVASAAYFQGRPYRLSYGTAFSFFVNFYMALLTVAPWAVMVRTHRFHYRSLSWHAMRTNRLLRDVLIAALVFAALTVLHRMVTERLRPVVMLVLFFPVLSLTLKHGWRACVFGGTFCLISICLVVEWRPGYGMSIEVQQIQALLASAITVLYVFGARLSTQAQVLETLQHETFQAQQVVKKSLVLSEDRLQQTSLALECVVGIMRMDYTRVMQRFIPEAMHDDYSQDFWNVQREVYHLAESIYPSAWRERGLAAAMEETIGAVLREAGISYSCDTPGQRLRFLSKASQVVLYRMACSAVANFSASPACIGVHLTLRMGRRRDVPWAALRIDSMLEESQVAYGLLQAKARQGVADKLGTRVIADGELKLLARLFQGNARCRPTSSGLRFTALLGNIGSRSASQHALIAPVRLWAR